MIFTGNREDVAQFVGDILIIFPSVYRSITITKLENSEACYVNIVTDTLSEDIARRLGLIYSVRHMNILSLSTQDG